MSKTFKHAARFPMKVIENGKNLKNLKHTQIRPKMGPNGQFYVN